MVAASASGRGFFNLRQLCRNTRLSFSGQHRRITTLPEFKNGHTKIPAPCPRGHSQDTIFISSVIIVPWLDTIDMRAIKNPESRDLIANYSDYLPIVLNRYFARSGAIDAATPGQHEIPFDGDIVQVIVDENGTLYVVVKRICDNLEITVQSQLKKLREAAWSGVTNLITPDPRGRKQELSVIPLDRLPMWLSSINPGKVAEHMRGKVERYQLQVADVLGRYFIKGETIVPPIPQPAPLADPDRHLDLIARSFAGMAEKVGDIAGAVVQLTIS